MYSAYFDHEIVMFHDDCIIIGTYLGGFNVISNKALERLYNAYLMGDGYEDLIDECIERLEKEGKLPETSDVYKFDFKQRLFTQFLSYINEMSDLFHVRRDSESVYRAACEIIDFDNKIKENKSDDKKSDVKIEADLNVMELMKDEGKTYKDIKHYWQDKITPFYYILGYKAGYNAAKNNEPDVYPEYNDKATLIKKLWDDETTPSK